MSKKTGSIPYGVIILSVPCFQQVNPRKICSHMYFGKRIGERMSPSGKEQPVKNHLNKNDDNVRF